jgi:hypothetical protein
MLHDAAVTHDPTSRTWRRPALTSTWEAALFCAVDGRHWGSVRGGWGISHRQDRRYAVYRIGGLRLTEFDNLRCARRFCEAIDGLTDWSRPHAELIADAQLGLALHRAALRVTGGRPALCIV